MICLVLLPLILSMVLGVLGALLGMAIAWGLLWSSRTWSTGEKLLATLVWPGGWVAPMLLGLVSTQSCQSAFVTDEAGRIMETSPEVCTGFAMPLWLGVPTLVVAVAAPLVVGAVLLHRGSGRRG